jgi:CubicO group peptidase (beta-lactamase class C family)
LPVILILHAGYFVVSAQSTEAKFDSLMSKFMDYCHFNGAVLVSENGEITYKKAFGYANMEWKVPNTAASCFKLVSLGKQFTALLILQLVEEGKIRLDGISVTICPIILKKQVRS